MFTLQCSKLSLKSYMVYFTILLFPFPQMHLGRFVSSCPLFGRIHCRRGRTNRCNYIMVTTDTIPLGAWQRCLPLFCVPHHFHISSCTELARHSSGQLRYITLASPIRLQCSRCVHAGAFCLSGSSWSTSWSCNDMRWKIIGHDMTVAHGDQSCILIWDLSMNFFLLSLVQCFCFTFSFMNCSAVAVLSANISEEPFHIAATDFNFCLRRGLPMQIALIAVHLVPISNFRLLHLPVPCHCLFRVVWAPQPKSKEFFLFVINASKTKNIFRWNPPEGWAFPPSKLSICSQRRFSLQSGQKLAIVPFGWRPL